MAHPAQRILAWIAISALVFPGSLQARVDDPATAYKSKDPAVRLDAIRAVLGDGGELDEAERSKLLVRALKDDDWEIAEEAARGLGESGLEKALPPLVDLALKGPVRRLRRIAARAAGGIDAEEAYAAFAKKATGKSAIVAAQALAELHGRIEAPSTAALEKALKRKEPEARAAAAFALMLFSTEPVTRFDELFAEEDTSVLEKAALIDGAGQAGDPALLASLRRALEEDEAEDVLVRRAYEAIREIFVAQPERANELLALLRCPSA